MTWVRVAVISAAVGLVAAVLPAIATGGVAEAAGSPSGVAMPGDIPGWTRTFADDFSGTTLDSTKWGKYAGIPKSSSVAMWDQSHVVVGSGLMTIVGTRSGDRFVTGGVSSARAGGQKYGRWELRFRADKGDAIGYALLMYPSSGGWPPEIDFAEDFGGNKTQTMATLHWGSTNQQIHKFGYADFSQWHTVGLIWTPGRVDYLLDGAVFASVTGSGVPAEPMWLGMQTEAKTCNSSGSNCPNGVAPTSADLEVDWVVRYAATSTTPPTPPTTPPTTPTPPTVPPVTPPAPPTVPTPPTVPPVIPPVSPPTVASTVRSRLAVTAPTSVVAGQRVRVTARLAAAPGAASKTVPVVFRDRNGVRRSATVVSVRPVPGSPGLYQGSSSLVVTHSGRIGASYAGASANGVSIDTAASTSVKVGAKAVIRGFATTTTSVRRGSRLTDVVALAPVGSTAYLQRQRCSGSACTWRSVKKWTVRSHGRIALRWVVPKGAARWRVVVRGGPLAAVAITGTRRTVGR